MDIVMDITKDVIYLYKASPLRCLWISLLSLITIAINNYVYLVINDNTGPSTICTFR